MPEATDPKISIVVATYNRPDALALVLRALAAQRAGNFEVLVADDGSGPETAAVVARLAPGLPYPCRHIWQRDDGFRLAMVRNRATVEATGDYLIFLDGDCLPLPDFVTQHRRMAVPGWFVTGNRIQLSQGLTHRTIEASLALWNWSRLDWIRARLRDDINLLVPLLRMRNRSRPKPDWVGAQGCNIAVWRADYLAVNGFDEAFFGWGYEDSDFVHRLIVSGCRRRATRWNVPILHLWHEVHDRSKEAGNRALFEQTVASGRVRAKRGVDQYLLEDARPLSRQLI
jgi:glycosyltransferase involved in cell wall biosynthesis